MLEPTVLHHTFTILRSYSKPPSRVFSAFADPLKKQRWFAEGLSHDVEEFEMQFEVGGRERARYRFRAGTQFSGMALIHEASFLEIVPEKRIVAASTMGFETKRFSASLVTFEFIADAQGTQLRFTHQGAFFEGADGPQMRESGWQQLLSQLKTEMSRGA
jgi:uncharacterized protein YndB with AHSA1/START domain